MHTVASSDLALASRSLYTPPPTPASRLGKHMYVHKMVFKMKLRIRNVAIKQAERKAPNKVKGDFAMLSFSHTSHTHTSQVDNGDGRSR